MSYIFLKELNLKEFSLNAPNTWPWALFMFIFIFRQPPATFCLFKTHFKWYSHMMRVMATCLAYFMASFYIPSDLGSRHGQRTQHKLHFC